MTNAVFVTKIDTHYDDLPESHYHFPKMYLSRIEEAVGDWIIYYEPRRKGKGRPGGMEYFAIARVREIQHDPAQPDHYYAFVEEYEEFVERVPFKPDHDYLEGRLQNTDGTINMGRARIPVRHISRQEFELIAQLGFSHLLRPEKLENKPEFFGLAEEQADFQRPIVEHLVRTKVRKRIFSSNVRRAYDLTCAFTGLKLINGGGRPEVQAAHVRPVSENGPDTVRNGIALSATAHWMFDRGLVGIDDDYRLIVAEDRLPDQALSYLNSDGKMKLPNDPTLRPHPAYLRYHRENILKVP